MTRPAQPQEYGSRRPVQPRDYETRQTEQPREYGVSAARTATPQRRFPAGTNGWLSARDEQDNYLRAAVVDGELAPLPRGVYRLVGQLNGPDGIQYVAETVTL